MFVLFNTVKRINPKSKTLSAFPDKGKDGGETSRVGGSG
jgi:hypothetical protein